MPTSTLGGCGHPPLRNLPFRQVCLLTQSVTHCQRRLAAKLKFEVIFMEIRRAEIRDIPGMIALLDQVGEVHHVIRPDIFRPGARKYDDAALRELLQDEATPIFVAVKDNFVAGYCFCQIRNYSGSPVLTDRKEIYIDDLCVDEHCRKQGIASALTSMLALEVLKLDKVPFYCTAWCNLKSARNAIKCGFAPAWVELTARDIDFVNEFNRGLKL